jgi:ankyrin repeat protein
LVSQKVDGDTPRTDKKKTCLFAAAEKGHLKVVQLLHITAKCNPNTPNVDGASPLWIAAEGGHVDVVRYLHSVSCDLNFRNNNGGNEGKLSFFFLFVIQQNQNKQKKKKKKKKTKKATIQTIQNRNTSFCCIGEGTFIGCEIFTSK